MAKRKRERRIDPPELITATLGVIGEEGATTVETGEGVALADYGIPGERATVELYRERLGVRYGRVVEVLDPSAHRVEPPCEYFGRCGGCQWQHIEYSEQLNLMRDIVRERLQCIGGFDDPPVSPTVGADDPWGYRNHVRFSARPRGEIGYVERGTRRFLRVDHCLIAHPRVNEVLELMQERGGGLHQLAVRLGVNTGDMLIHPDISETEPSLPSGQKFYHEEILGHRFRISGASFFQTNTPQAERLVGIVRERLELSRGDVLLDAYAGVGTFAVILASSVRKVIAVEESAAAVDDAMVNIEGYDNIHYYRGKVEDVLPDLDEPTDAIILDPPRLGCHPATIKAVRRNAPSRIVYVSCDPSTLARDLRLLADREADDAAYDIADVTPVDMFPHTHHIECVATLRRAD